MKYLYIHGLNSTGEETKTNLYKVLAENVINLDWDSTVCYRTNVEHLQEQIDAYMGEDIILIGSSLGGFYTRILSNTNQVPCVLINPVMDIRKTYEVIKNNPFYSNITQDIINSYDLAVINDIIIPRVVIVGCKDSIVNPTDTISYWKNKCNLIITEDKHQIENFEPFKYAIFSLSQPLFYDIHEISR